jgi:iron complex outermembrane recepter protein
MLTKSGNVSLNFLKISIICGLLIPVYLFGQQTKHLSGVVIDAQKRQPLEGANIISLDKSGKGAFTDKGGHFDLVTLSDSIAISYLGYRTEILSVSGENLFIQVELFPLGSNLLQTIEVRSTSIALSKPLGLGILNRNEFIMDDGISVRNGINRIPGVFMQSGTFNTNRISIRGVGSRSAFGTSKIRMYLDDIPLTTGDGSSAIEDIDPLLLDEIMIIKGPSAGSFGAGLGGVIQLKTGLGNEFGTTLKSGYQMGSYQTERYFSGIQHREKNFSANIHYTNTSSEGYRENSQFNREALFGVFEMIHGERHQSKFVFNYLTNKAYIPSSINLKDFTEAPYKAAANWLAMKGFEDYNILNGGYSHRIQLSSESARINWSAHLTGFFGFNQNFEPRPFNTLRESGNVIGTRSYISAISVEKSILKSARFGVEGYREHFLWTTHRASAGKLVQLLSDNEENRNYFNLFGEIEWNLAKKWFVLTGINLNRTKFNYTDHFFQDNADQSGIKRYDPVISPRLSLGYPLLSGLTLYGGISHGFSPPSLEETLLPDGGVNPGIQPERGWMFEMGGKGNVLKGKLEYDVTLYRLNIYDLLVSRRLADDQYLGINAGKTVHLGLEALLRAYLSSSMEIYASYHLTNYKFGEFKDGDADYSGNFLTGVAPNTFIGGIVFGKETGFFTNIHFEYVDKMPMRDDNSIFSDAYLLTNVRGGYTFSKSKWRLKIFGGINNVTDERYAGMILVNAASFGNVPPRYYYPGLPRNVYGGMEFNYRFQTK